MTKTLLGLVTAAALGVAASAAGAATLGTIDFTAAGTGLSGSVGGASWALTGSDGVNPATPNNAQPYDGTDGNPSTDDKPANSFGLVFTTDGYGIIDDEVSNPPPESMTVTFNQMVQIIGFSFLDLFKHATGSTGESVTASFSDGVSVTDTIVLMFNNTNATKGGYAESLFSIAAKSVTFVVNLPNNDGRGVADGALASLTIAPVPLPAGMLLLATALGGFGVARRLRKSV